MSAVWLMFFMLFAVLLLVQYKTDDYGHTLIRNKRLILHFDTTDIIAFGLIISFSLLCATRSESTYDTEVYKNWYLRIIRFPVNQIEGSYGLVFEILSRFLGAIFGTRFRLYLFSIPLINHLIVYQVLRKANGVGTVGYLLYVFFVGFFYNYAVLRQSLALTFVIWAFASWRNKKKLFTLLILAALSHNTAIVVLLLAIIVHFVQFGKRFLLIVWGLATFNYVFPFSERFLQRIILTISRFIPNSMTGRYELYFVREYTSRSFSVFYLLYFLAIFVMILYLYNDEGQGTHLIRITRRKTTGINESTMEYLESINDSEKIENKRMLNIGVAGITLLSLGAAFTIIIRVVDYAILPCLVFMIPLYVRRKNTTIGRLYMLALCSIALILYLRIFLTQSPLYYGI